MFATNLKKTQSLTATQRLKKTSRYRASSPSGPVTLEPANLNELRKIIEPAAKAPLPIRPRGAGTAATDCNRSETGTTLKTTGLDQITSVDSYNHTVTVQAGVRLETLVAELAEHGLELVGSYDLRGRTVGGAISAPCYGPCVGGDGGYFASQAVSMKFVRADGEVLRITPEQHNLLGAFRTSFGMLGVLYEATLKVRPIRNFTASHREIDIEKFASVVDALANGDVGFRFYLMPHRDRVFLELRRYEANPGRAYGAPWRLKGWGENAVLPKICRSANRLMPVQSLRYRMIDRGAEVTQRLVSSRFVRSGNNATGQPGNLKRPGASRSYYSTWCFPAANFSMIVKAYRDFCESILATTGYRCDLPASGFRLCHDPSSLLSPSFDESMIAITTATTQAQGWEDFVIDLAEFAEKWGGMPLISQSRALRANHVIQTYSKRLDFFRRMRRQLDPESRFLSPFMAQFCQ